jgi:hypothetical protein
MHTHIREVPLGKGEGTFSLSDEPLPEATGSDALKSIHASLTSLHNQLSAVAAKAWELDLHASASDLRHLTNCVGGYIAEAQRRIVAGKG